MSGVEGEAAVLAKRRSILELAICGRLPVGKGFFNGDAELVGAAICSTC